jgi:hypothetical protein
MNIEPRLRKLVMQHDAAAVQSPFGICIQPVDDQPHLEDIIVTPNPESLDSLFISDFAKVAAPDGLCVNALVSYHGASP